MRRSPYRPAFDRLDDRFALSSILPAPGVASAAIATADGPIHEPWPFDPAGDMEPPGDSTPLPDIVFADPSPGNTGTGQVIAPGEDGPVYVSYPIPVTGDEPPPGDPAAADPGDIFGVPSEGPSDDGPGIIID